MRSAGGREEHGEGIGRGKEGEKRTHPGHVKGPARRPSQAVTKRALRTKGQGDSGDAKGRGTRAERAGEMQLHS